MSCSSQYCRCWLGTLCFRGGVGACRCRCAGLQLLLIFCSFLLFFHHWGGGPVAEGLGHGVIFAFACSGFQGGSASWLRCSPKTAVSQGSSNPRLPQETKRCRETIPTDLKTANWPKRPDTLQDLKSFLLADFSTTQTTKGTKEGRATGRPKRPC